MKVHIEEDDIRRLVTNERADAFGIVGGHDSAKMGAEEKLSGREYAAIVVDDKDGGGEHAFHRSPFKSSLRYIAVRITEKDCAGMPSVVGVSLRMFSTSRACSLLRRSICTMRPKGTV